MLRFVKGQELRTKAELEELARAQPGTTKTKQGHPTQTLQDQVPRVDCRTKGAPVTSEPGGHKSTAWLCSIGASSMSPDLLAPEDV
jgi:hypothetical protein